MSDRNSPTSPRRARAAERRLQALELRIRGMKYREIGAELHVTGSAAYKACARALREISARTGETAELLRRLEVERLDSLWAAAFPGALKGDPATVRACLAIMERRARLLGLDAAQE